MLASVVIYQAAYLHCKTQNSPSFSFPARMPATPPNIAGNLLIHPVKNYKQWVRTNT